VLVLAELASFLSLDMLLCRYQRPRDDWRSTTEAYIRSPRANSEGGVCMVMDSMETKNPNDTRSLNRKVVIPNGYVVSNHH